MYFHNTAAACNLSEICTLLHLGIERKRIGTVTEKTYMWTDELYLYLSLYSSAVHPAGYIHCVSPDVILWPPGSNHSCHHWAHIDAWC